MRPGCVPVIAGLLMVAHFHASGGELGGIRDVQIRSNRIVTVWLGYDSVDAKASDGSLYAITSPDDPDFKPGLRPAAVARFARGSRFRNNRTFTDNLVHLTVGRPFKRGKTYAVTVAGGVIPARYKQSIAFSFDGTPNPGFKLNQIGYSRAARVKLVYLSSYLGDGPPLDLSACTRFEVRSAKDHSVVLQGPIRKVSDRDPQGLDTLYVLDISALDREGAFYVWVDGLGRSYTFKNGDLAARAMYDCCARGMYFQRSGTAIPSQYGGKWPRAMGHDKIYVNRKNVVHPWRRRLDPSKTSAGDYYVPEGPREIHGGHYDAGDFDLRPMHINVPVLLMTLYDSLPQKFYDGQTLVPENKNGTPDILDEAAWNLLSLEYIQDYAGEVRGLKGGVAPGMESYGHPPHPCIGPTDPLPYFMRKVTPYFSFSASAAFAQAARVFAPFDAERAKRYLARSRAAYGYAVTHKDERWTDGKEQGEKYDGNLLNSAWCWAAGELFSTTGEAGYWNDFRSRYRAVRDGVAGSINRWGVLWGVITTKQPGVDVGIVNELKAGLLREADRGVQMVEENGRRGYRASVRESGGWGSTACVVRNIEANTRGYLLTRKQEYLDAFATSIDFSLGMNPSEMSWMTGGGTVYPMDPCSHNSIYDGVDDPLPGILIYGPTNYWKSEYCVLYPDKAKMGFYRRVADVWRHIPGCEYTVWETQAPFMFVVGMLLPDGGPAEKPSPASSSAPSSTPSSTKEPKRPKRGVSRPPRPGPEEPAEPELSPEEVERRRRYKEAETAFIEGDLDRAKKLFRAVVEESPDSEDAAKAKEYLDILE